MSIELTEIVNCQIRGPRSFLKKEPVLLDQNIKSEQVETCNDCTWIVDGQKAGKFIILPNSSIPLAKCTNFGCANNQWLEDKSH